MKGLVRGLGTLFFSIFLVSLFQFSPRAESPACPPNFIATNSGCRFDDPALKWQIPPNGLIRPWPAIAPEHTRHLTPQKIELGRLLFFDPILSGDNKTSCAHCHDPKNGLGDGHRLGRGKNATGVGKTRKGGVTLKRNTPTLFNVAFEAHYFWDGRAKTLEHQAIFPITNPEEMNQSLEQLPTELQKITGYQQLFNDAFPGENGGISLNNIFISLSAFQRTLISVNSPYDRFVNGESSALSEPAIRGLQVFRSLNTRCFECHQPPSFNGVGLFTIGVPPVKGDPPDLGAMEQSQAEGQREAFKVSTLRNIALTAPYMHNGKFKTLEEVLDFYAKGGGHGSGHSLPNINRQIMKFNFDGTEKEDLLAFLHSLTDESQLPKIPVKVPSGLPVLK